MRAEPPLCFPRRVPCFLSKRIRGTARSLPAAFWWLWLGTLINRAGTFIHPFLVLYLTGPRGFSERTAGAVLTAWGLGLLLSHPLGGVLTDRFGRKVALGTGLFGTSALLALLGLARSLLLIAGLVFLLGVFADLYRPASMALVADVVPPEGRQRAFALVFWAINMGYAVATITAAVLLQHGYGLLFALDALTTAAFGVLILRFVVETKPDGGESAVRILDPIRLLRRDRLLLGATVLTLAYAILYIQVIVALPFAVRDAGLSASVYGYVVSLNGVLIVVLQPLTIRRLDEWPRRVTLPAGMALVGIGIALTGLCSAPWQFALTVVLWTSGEIATAGSFQALVAALAPEHQRGRYAGALGLAWGVSGLAGPLLGSISYATAPVLTWTGCLALGLVAALGQRALLAAIERRTDSAVSFTSAAVADDVERV